MADIVTAGPETAVPRNSTADEGEVGDLPVDEPVAYLYHHSLRSPTISCVILVSGGLHVQTRECPLRVPTPSWKPGVPANAPNTTNALRNGN